MVIKSGKNNSLNEPDVCGECELTLLIPKLAVNQKALCPRCGYLLTARRNNCLDRILAFAISALIFLILSFQFEFISFEYNGLGDSIKLLDSVSILIDNGYAWLAIIEVASVFVIPGFILISLIYLVFFLRQGRYPPKGLGLTSVIFKLIPWNMVEIFLIGTLVSFVKIISIAEIGLGTSYFSFILFSISMTAALLHLDKRAFYQALTMRRAEQQRVRVPVSEPAEPKLIPQVTSSDKRRANSLSIQKTWALIITAILLYIPANILPIMNTQFLGQNEPNTIIGGVLLLWQEKSYPIAMVVFIASIMVPITKIASLIWLNYSVQIHSGQLSHQRILLYRAAEFIGRWSMVDIFVVITLTSLVQLGNTMSIIPGPASLAFSAVVIVTMLAAMSFEPKLIYNEY
ncbi:paraquat-inducible protein A [Shewanella schlegeliana]|uniref:Paraquat-inducible protein A n=1 Tax=Shewanella schlegeliana TaxID=190308 RepID=A0ABS1T0P6_9GAMM|nr:paraquat-inducible protein A [Shewanella schlegeliana]MBL4914351.1 paraquat-inducible protein A [Shewanella schlegeliana]MCL1109426.1 paraquat-inducible protein A [Shewanella schlegeliana]GIU32036.1 paraquat-inducible protein A [Shewanella schlegeliana]